MTGKYQILYMWNKINIFANNNKRFDYGMNEPYILNSKIQYNRKYMCFVVIGIYFI